MQAIRRDALAKGCITVQNHAGEGGSSPRKSGHTIHGLAEAASRIHLRKREHLFCRIRVALVTAPTYTTMDNGNNGASVHTYIFTPEVLEQRETEFMPAAGLAEEGAGGFHIPALSDPNTYKDGQTPTTITLIAIEWVALTGQRLRKVRGAGILLIASHTRGDNRIDSAWKAMVTKHYSRPTWKGRGTANRLSAMRTMRRSLATPREAVRAAIRSLSISTHAPAPPG